ncbi:hypothetical protein E1B28_010378 [Marasmius oreades]|uniref:Nephrocystin 3-like N-terminal domain-containing protein n=1 Tax=Marasmius oreades TaxID=181124 RepID=A0A9P7RX48_9AGAR|nr:uncharacterized protein E1B28_010378 [Marasmius oreades]KAG7091335.1 hypothetical protein E1B28_010378 [Marasmius oreades]
MSFTKSSNLRVVDSAISYIRGDKNVTHIGDKYYQDSSRNRWCSLLTDSGLATLSSQVAFSALHDSEARYPQPNVLPGTRGGIIETLSRWCEDPFKRNRVYWISGAAGVGKSAIAQALSEKYIQTGQLAASFFFSRNDATRDKLDPFVATIAHQLATSNNLKSLLAPLIDHTIHSSPGSLHKQWETQFTTLIEEPCAQVDPRQWLRLPRLVIIDGVDECIEVKSQKRLLRMIGNSTSTLPLDFLIFSRPEPHISQIFHHESFIPSPSRLALGDFAVWNDIERYFRHEFARIREEHWHKLPSSQASWPGEFVIHQLLCKATGQFIYATTVMKFIDTGKLPVTPGLRLEIILRAGRIVDSSSPYPDLDQLYSQILKLCINEGGKLQKILRLIVSPFEGLNVLKSPFRLRDSPAVGLQSLWALEQLLGLSEGEAAAFLSGLHSILDVPSVRTDNVAVLHASFSEFLLDRHRAGVYYVGEQLSSQEWNQLLVPWQVRTLSRFCIESESWPVHSQDHPINGIHDVDNGSLNVWKYLYDNRTTIAINDEIAAALNAFDPHLYLATLLHWTYELDPLVQRTQPPSSTIRAPIRAPKLGSISLPPRNATVSRQGGKSRDWRHQTLSVHAQISMLYSVFRMLKIFQKMQIFISRFLRLIPWRSGP